MDVFNVAQDVFDFIGIQASGNFVEQQQLRIRTQGGCHGHAFLRCHRQFADQVIGQFGQPQKGQHFIRPGCGPGSGTGVHKTAHHHIFSHVEITGSGIDLEGAGQSLPGHLVGF